MVFGATEAGNFQHFHLISWDSAIGNVLDSNGIADTQITTLYNCVEQKGSHMFMDGKPPGSSQLSTFSESQTLVLGRVELKLLWSSAGEAHLLHGLACVCAFLLTTVRKSRYLQ